MLKLKAALSEKEKKESAGKLLELWLEIGMHCHLKCKFCFNDGGGHIDNGGSLGMNDYKIILQQFKDLGGKVIGIPGGGEPLYFTNFAKTMMVISYAKKLGLRVILFTSGDLIDEGIARELKILDVSLLIKFNSPFASVQDVLVGFDGYTNRRDKALKILQKLGFMNREKDGEGNSISSVGFVTPILYENYDQLPNIFRYCLHNNIVPDIDTVIPTGRGASFSKVEDEATRKMFLKLQKISKDEFGEEWEISPTYVGGCCDRHKYHLYVDCEGNVSPCLGANKKNVFLANTCEKNSLSRAWNSMLMKKIKERKYSGRCMNCKSFENKICNSCLGRYTNSISEEEICTTGCWNFED
jgi:MoaA/NifB/PqqE/SkfB family radical SAM enzyme